MGFDCGFDMVPSLTASEADTSRWLDFLDEIKATYRDDPTVLATPSVIEFRVGEHPCLPIEGQKFLRFSSKVNGSRTAAAEPYIRKVCAVARRHFGNQVQFWHELAEDYGHYGWSQVNESLQSYRSSVSVSLAARRKPGYMLTARKSHNASTVPTSMSSDAPRPERVKETAAAPLFTLQPLLGKGSGLLATQKISKGRRILAEKPLFIVSRRGYDRRSASLAVAAKLQQLSRDDQRTFFSLHNNFDKSWSPFLGIVKTNALPLGSEATEGGIFPVASRINHACSPNCQHTWNANRGEETIHAVRDLAEGEEITIAYSETGPSKQRRIRLKEEFNFECMCSLCSLPENELLRSDERLEEIQRLDERIGDGFHLMSQPRQHLQWVHSLLLLLDAENISDARLPRAYYDAFQTVIAQGDQARAKVFAERAYEARRYCEGEDSETALFVKQLAADPRGHRLFGASKAWAQGTTKIPEGRKSNEFEKWLWKQM